MRRLWNRLKRLWNWILRRNRQRAASLFFERCTQLGRDQIQAAEDERVLSELKKEVDDLSHHRGECGPRTFDGGNHDVCRRALVCKVAHCPGHVPRDVTGESSWCPIYRKEFGWVHVGKRLRKEWYSVITIHAPEGTIRMDDGERPFRYREVGGPRGGSVLVPIEGDPKGLYVVTKDGSNGGTHG